MKRIDAVTEAGSAELPVVRIGPIAHGGHCVARLDGKVVFVRHALPGELVRIQVTESGSRYLRADVIEVLEPGRGRVEPACEYAGSCGGCDFQHIEAARQCELLGEVIAEQLRRVAGIEWQVQVEQLSPELGWRTRMSWAVDPSGRPGLRRYRSHEVVGVRNCLIAHPDLPVVLGKHWHDRTVEAVVSSTGHKLLACDGPVPEQTEADGVVGSTGAPRSGQPRLTEQVLGRKFSVTGTGFWQIHPAAAPTLVRAVLSAAAVQPGDRVFDLYAGAGLFTAFLAEAAGPDGQVVSIEANRVASSDARRNLQDLANVQIVNASTERALAQHRSGRQRLGSADLVVLDPPRSGAKRAIDNIAALGPRTIVYVACDPAALARDIAALQRHGYQLDQLRAFALFPMTHHVECVAALSRSE